MKISMSAQGGLARGKVGPTFEEKLSKRKAWFGDWNESVLLWEQKGKQPRFPPLL